MGFHRRIVAGSKASSLALALVVGAALAACRRAPPTSSPSAESKPPADRLAPGEAPPGADKAFDLVLPRGAQISGRFADTIDAEIALPTEDVANYFRGQAEEDAEAVVGANGTVFPVLRVKGSEPGHHLRVTVTAGARTHVEVVRIVETPLPTPNEPNDELMKKAGLAPNGALLDPQHRY